MEANNPDNLEFSGILFLVSGEHLIAVNFETRSHLGQLLKYSEKRGLKPYFKAREERALDIVIGAADKMAHAAGPEPAPKCKAHGVTMKPSSKKGVKFFCPRKDGDEYCSHWVDTRDRYHT